MRQMEAKSEAMRTARLLVTVMLLAAARASSQEQADAQRAGVTRQLVISLQDRQLALLENGEVTRIFPVAVGKETTPSPSGSFKIITRITDPTYYHPGKVIPAGPQNPLGNRWIGLNQKGYGIHGTNEPKSIGTAASHGCIRMAKQDLEELFEIVRPGDVVEIRAERDQQTAQMFGRGAAEPVVIASANTAAVQAERAASSTR